MLTSLRVGGAKVYPGCGEIAKNIFSSYPKLVLRFQQHYYHEIKASKKQWKSTLRNRPHSGRPLLLAAILALAVFFLNFGQDPLWYLFFRWHFVSFSAFLLKFVTFPNDLVFLYFPVQVAIQAQPGWLRAHIYRLVSSHNHHKSDRPSSSPSIIPGD